MLQNLNRDFRAVPFILAAVLTYAPGGLRSSLGASMDGVSLSQAADFHSAVVPTAGLTAGPAEDIIFKKTRFSSVKQPNEADVNLMITNSKVVIKSKRVNKKAPAIDVEIPYSSIDSMSYELATRHRVAEGASVMALSLGAGAILMATKTKSHWLAIEYQENSAKQATLLRLDKSEYKSAIAALESRSGKRVAILDSKENSLNPTAESKDIDEFIPFGLVKVVAVLKPAMESEGCKVTVATASRIECKRPRGHSEQTGSGGESVTATLEAKGEQTRVRISTGKGVVGRIGKKNWSTPIYQELMKSLRKPAPSAKSAVANDGNSLILFSDKFSPYGARDGKNSRSRAQAEAVGSTMNRYESQNGNSGFEGIFTLRVQKMGSLE